MKGKKIVKILCAFLMMFSIAFVADMKADAAEAGEMKGITAEADTLSWDSMSVTANKARAGYYEENPFVVKTMLNSSYGAPAYTNYALDGAGYWKLIPVTPNYTGRLYLDVKVNGSSSDVMNIYLVTSYVETADGINVTWGQTQEGYTGYAYYGGNTDKSYYVPATKGQTFYVLIQEAAENTGAMSVDICARVFTTLQRTLTQGASNFALVSGVNKAGNANTTLFKVTPKTTGVLSATIKEYGYSTSDCYVQLLNANKNAVSNRVYFNSSSAGNKAYFGVKKGTTYYLKITQCAGTQNNWYKYGVKYSVTQRTDRAIGTKSSAKKLTRKAAATNTLFVASTSQSTDWYKFNVSSQRYSKVRVDASAIKSGTLYVTLYKGSKKLISGEVPANKYYEIYGTLAKGDYYLKVVKGTKASGKYTVRYVQ